MNNYNEKKEKKGFVLSLFRSSIILSFVDRFTAYIYTLIKNGFFGFIFSGYREENRSYVADRISSFKLFHHLGELRYGICRAVENSLFVNITGRFAAFLLQCRLKVYGAFLISLGAYTAIILSVNSITAGTVTDLPGNLGFVLSIVLIVSSVPLVISRKSLARALNDSLVGRFILRITDFTPINQSLLTDVKGHSSISFLFGVIIAFAANIFAPNHGVLYFFIACIGAVWAYVVLIRPEIGVLTLFLLLPFLPTMVLAAILIYTFLCWCIKVLRGKRVLSFEPIDIAVIFFAVVIFSGGIISLSPASLKPALLMVCLILGFFLSVQLLRKREWLIRCSAAAVISGTLVSLYGIFLYYTGGGYFSSAWVDDEMFNGISSRAVSTLENPNMLGEYLIIIIPIALAMLIGKGEGLRKLPALFCLGILGACLILTWSRGAWLALIVTLIAFVLMWHHRSVWLIIAGICSIPILPSVLPASVLSRFTSIGNMADSSTSYRVYIWRAAVNMISDNPIAGIGIGEDAWRRIYPLYSYMGIEAAPHSHNLFMQIWLETGIFGILSFMIIIFLLLQSAFTLFRRISSGSTLKTPELTESTMLFNDNTGKGKHDAQRISRKQLRISVMGPLCGIIAVLAQGFTDYSWYNYRLYLFFWLITGLCIGYIRNGSSFLNTVKQTDNNDLSSDSIFLIARKKNMKRSRGGK